MRKFQSHKIVEAAQIHGVDREVSAIYTKDGEVIRVPEDFFARGGPKTNDYIVRYDNAYLSWSPRDVFDSGYTLIEDDSAFIAHATRELEIIFGPDTGEDEYHGIIRNGVLAVLRVFAKQGYSGESAAISANLLDKLLRFEPLSPLTGADDEWIEVTDFGPSNEPQFQNIRCSHVFKERNGHAYDSEGRIFKDRDGTCRQSPAESRVYITFPYTPVTVYVDRDNDPDEPKGTVQ